MRHWLLGSSIATIFVLGTQLAGAQAPVQNQGGGAASHSQGGTPAGQGAEQRGGRQGQESTPDSSGFERRSSQQDTREQFGERGSRRDEQSQGGQDRRSRMGADDRGEDRRYRSERDEGDRRFEEGRRPEEGRRFGEGRRYDERGDRFFDERRRSGDRYEERGYGERRYGSRVDRAYTGPRNLQITRRQRARVHDILVGRRVEPAHVDFPIRIGARVPSYITSYQLPEEIYDYAPGYEGYRYFLANDEIVIVDPDSMDVVAVLED
jgi:hypothetical protein